MSCAYQVGIFMQDAAFVKVGSKPPFPAICVKVRSAGLDPFGPQATKPSDV
ncbi:hypothetical protein SAMN05421665_3508 [Yoonia rosea]|uniref:Uncharacterized protein n=1 Tax=Yoonia rosea TaxID=287098 RepID=A0A1R3XJW9_9RHOB|nr:hypothetical protein SAMN05421665_3508 [Yoonia rosea]